MVDDDRLVLATLVHGLAQAGYQVIDADNGNDAILLAREHRPDLALLDIRMEGMSGFDVAETLRDATASPSCSSRPSATTQRWRRSGARRGGLPRQAAGHPPDRAGGRGGAANVGARRAAARLAHRWPAPMVLDPVVAMAVGVLMHRYSLTRGAALERLERQAESEQRAPAEQAERLLQAVELLSSSGS